VILARWMMCVGASLVLMAMGALLMLLGLGA